MIFMTTITEKEGNAMPFTEILQGMRTLLHLLIGLCYAYQLVYLFLPLFRKENIPVSDCNRRYAILIAARNEEAVLPHLLSSIRDQDYPADKLRVFVVADNCTDRTAVVAEEGGAVVFCRSSQTHIGKGYALRYLLEKIDELEGFDSFDGFLVFDADNLLQHDFIKCIDRLAAEGYDVFCGCRNSKNFGTNWVSSGHGLWYLHESAHLNRSRMLLGNPCMVTGTGFGFTRALLQQMGGWNFFTLTEDVEFSTWCILHGIRSGYCHEAVFYDEQPQKFSQSWRQRTRWVQGGIQVSLRYGGQLFKKLLCGGGYSCLEALTLQLWGYGAGILCSLLSLLTSVLTGNLFTFLLTTLVYSIAVPVLIGIMTLLSQWHQIPATTGKKLLSLVSFPLHVLSYIPIALTALFRKFSWPPIEHTAALSCKDLSQ